MAINLRMKRERYLTSIPGKTKTLLQPPGDVRLLDYGILDRKNEIASVIGIHEPLKIYIIFEIMKGVVNLFFIITILDDKGNQVIALGSNNYNRERFADLKEGKYKLILNIESHHLVAGVYRPSIAIRNEKTMETYSKFTEGVTFAIYSNQNHISGGIVHVKEKWQLQQIT